MADPELNLIAALLANEAMDAMEEDLDVGFFHKLERTYQQSPDLAKHKGREALINELQPRLVKILEQTFKKET